MIEEEKDKPHDDESPTVEDSQSNENEQGEGYVGPADPIDPPEDDDRQGDPLGPGK